MKCVSCGKSSAEISENLPACLNCIRSFPQKVFPEIKKVHLKSRREFKLPLTPPRDPQGVRCTLCVNSCQIPEGERGYCGLRTNQKGRLIHLAGTPELGLLQWYYDPLPTNCVADWVCAEGISPKPYSSGDRNLAVFYGACTFNCLFCQNWHYRNLVGSLMVEEGFSPGGSLEKFVSAEELAACVDNKTACICYFGGDPTPQLPHALKTSRLALDEAKRRGRTLRICFESNGSMSPSLLKEVAELSFESGGCIKFDLKAFNEDLNIALCGVTNERTLKNFQYLAKMGKKRKDPPFLIASTLLIPGYIDREEVYSLSKFIADLDPFLPYTLLAYYPCFYLPDLPTTSRHQAEESKAIALDAGLKRVRVGNIHLLT